MSTVIITGSTRGIGKSTSKFLYEKGYNVVICSRNEKNIKNTINELKDLKNQNGQLVGYKCDVSNPIDVSKLVGKTVQQFGNIDVLINNAGIAVYNNLIDTTLEDWFNTIKINLTGCFLFCKSVLPYMVKNKTGTIINISSGAGKMGFPNLSAYCASKFGVMGFSESIAKEFSATNIRIMVLCPGEIETDMLNEIINSGFELTTERKYLYKPVDVANKIFDMIEKKEIYSNGQVVEFYSGVKY